MATEAQIRANQENAQHSTGPNTEAGKAVSCRNNFRHGFTGAFTVLPSEDQEEFDHLFHGLSVEHQVRTMTERILVLKMAQHHWLGLRAQRLQDLAISDPALTQLEQERQFNLFLRYQITNDRAFHRSLTDLLKLRAEKRKQEIGFESQERKRNEEKQKQAAESRRDAAEKRKQELHTFAVLLAEAKADHQLVLTSNEKMNAYEAVCENRPAEIRKAA